MTRAPNDWDDWDLVLTSLSYTRRAFETYAYPTEELRQERLDDVHRAIAAISELKRKGRTC